LPRNDFMKEKITPGQIVLLVLSVYVLVAVFIETIFKLPQDIQAIINVADTVICIIFLGDFFLRLILAKDKLQFLKWGWIDFISSIPALSFLRWGRIVRVVRVLRILRAVRSTKFLFSILLKNRTESAFACACLISITMIIFSSIAILNLEDRPDCNIKNAEDALWWACATITTVGYGDRYPITTEGRIVGVVLMTVGVGLFGTFTGFVASWFLQNSRVQETKKTEEEEQLSESSTDA
jgi:voltage-gated potassium channel